MSHGQHILLPFMDKVPFFRLEK